MIGKVTDNNIQFLEGGGEMGELIRIKDWSKTSIGSPQSWPQSLRTALSIVLHSKFPMFIWWGPELICFYNDAYRPSLGKNGKHPSILGQKAEDAWSEIWDIIKPLIDQVLAGGDSTWSEDQLIPIYRNGTIEDVYWTFSYSPIYDESAKPAGVLVTCNETTDKVTTLKKLAESKDQLAFAIESADIATWDYNPATNKFTSNDRLKSWFGLPSEAELELSIAINAIAEKDRERVVEAIQKVLDFSSGGYYDIEYSIINGLTGKETIVKAKGRAWFNEENIAYRFNGILQDVTEEAIARRKVEESEKRFRDTVKQAPLGITIFYGPEFIVEMANATYLQIVDRKEIDFVGKPLFESLPEVEEVVSPLLNGVLKTGIAFHGTDFPVTLNRYGKKEQTYFNMVYQPLRDETGNISGIMVVATEVTASVKAKHALAESEKQFRNLVLQSPIPMAIFKGPDYIIEMANKIMFENIWRKKESDVIGKKALDVFPELVEQKYPELLLKVYTTGETYEEKEAMAYVYGDDGLKKFYLDFEYAALYDTDHIISGIIITVNDVTEKVEARIKVEESEERLRLATEATELSTWDLDIQSREIIHSPRLAEIFGHDKSKKITHQELRNQIHPDDISAIVEKAFDQALRTGMYKYEARVIKPNNIICWIRTQGQVFYDEKNNAIKLIGTLRDITEEKYHQQKLQEREQKFRLLADSMPQFVWTGDPDGKLNYFNESVYKYSGLTYEQIVKDGWIQIVHPDDREENIRAWAHSISAGEDFLMEHRFQRYDGEYHWQLSRAIPQKDASGNIQMWVGTSTDIQEQKNFTSELETQVQQRTKELEQKNNELKKMNTELQSFAYISSHDLQEPLRKIQTFAGRVLEKEQKNLSETGKSYFARMQGAANRMQTLIEDLLTYSRTNTSERIPTHLNEIIDEVIEDLKETLAKQNVTIDVQAMCEADIIPFQFRQLLNNLIGNSIKFSVAERPLHIQLKCEIANGSKLKLESLISEQKYCHFSVADNGIGFDPQYKDRIFELFQRLHGKEVYSGTGIGLAIVKKIVENHGGVITATGELNKGATFDIYIPLS